MQRPAAHFTVPLTAAVLAVAILLAGDASAQWQMSDQDGKSTLRIRFLAQPQGEWMDAPDALSTSRNLFLRRIRLILGAELDPS